MLKNKRIILIALYVVLAVYLLPMFPHGGSANELTRWATAASLIEKGSFEISWTESLIGKNVDTAQVNGKTYSNKAPGPAILAAPFYALTRVFVGPPDAANIRVSWFVMRFALSTLPLLFLAFWLYRREADAFSLAALLFATPLFLYSLLFFSHVFVAVLLYFAFRLLYDDREFSKKNFLLAGALCGLAVISEFPVVFAAAVFGAGLFFTGKEDRYRRILYFILGGLPFAAFLLIYNNALFGSPFSFSYAHESLPEWAEVAGQGVFGIGVPTLSNAYLLLFSPSRGLLFFSPVLLLSILFFIDAQGRKTLRDRVKIAAILLSVIILCGHGAAHGGWAFGARYLVFIIPLLLDSFLGKEKREIPDAARGLLFAVSFLFCAIPALTFSFAPPEFTFPHNDFWRMLLFGDGWFTPNLANVLGIAGVWTLLPVALIFAAILFLVVSGAQKPQRFAIGLLAGIAIAGIYMFLPGLDNGEAKLRRAGIEERFFRPENRLAPFVEEAKSKNDLNTLQRIDGYRWNIADTRAYAPNDFPYLLNQPLAGSPSAKLKAAIEAQKRGKTADAETILRKGKTEFPFALCEFSTGLAVIYYTTNRRDLALAELESVQPLVTKGSRPECIRSQFLLGSLYKELNRQDDAGKVFSSFMANSENTDDPELKNFRRQLTAK